MPDGRWSLGDRASKYGTADAARDKMVEELLAAHERKHAGGGATRLAELVRKAEAADAELAGQPPESEDERRYRELLRARVGRDDPTVDITKKPTETDDPWPTHMPGRRELPGRESFGRDRDTAESPSSDSVTCPSWSLFSEKPDVGCDKERADSTAGADREPRADSTRAEEMTSAISPTAK